MGEEQSIYKLTVGEKSVSFFPQTCAEGVLVKYKELGSEIDTETSLNKLIEHLILSKLSLITNMKPTADSEDESLTVMSTGQIAYIYHTNTVKNVSSANPSPYLISYDDKGHISASSPFKAINFTLNGEDSLSSYNGSEEVTINFELIISNILEGTIDSHTHSFKNLTDIPTTLSGYGITDAVTTANTNQTVNGIKSFTTLKALDLYAANNKIYFGSDTSNYITYDNTSGFSFSKSIYANQADLTNHTTNTNIHITADERTKWNNVTNSFYSIIGEDSDNIINKWEEVVAFLNNYSEADTLAGLLANKVDKADLPNLETLKALPLSCRTDDTSGVTYIEPVVTTGSTGDLINLGSYGKPFRQIYAQDFRAKDGKVILNPNSLQLVSDTSQIIFYDADKKVFKLHISGFAKTDDSGNITRKGLSFIEYSDPNKQGNFTLDKEGTYYDFYGHIHTYQTVTAGSFLIADETAQQSGGILRADGSIDTTTYLTNMSPAVGLRWIGQIGNYINVIPEDPNDSGKTLFNGLYSWVPENGGIPVENSYGLLLNLSNQETLSKSNVGVTGTWISQLGFSTTANKVYYRNRDGESAWTNWVQILTTATPATKETLGGIKAYSTSVLPTLTMNTGTSQCYPVLLDLSNFAYVRVPWVNTTYKPATSTSNGLMSASDKAKLDNISDEANAYTLPIATSETLGGIKVGQNLIADTEGLLSVLKLILSLTSGSTFWNGRNNALIRMTISKEDSNYYPFLSADTYAGSWEIGISNYQSDSTYQSLVFAYISDANNEKRNDSNIYTKYYLATDGTFYGITAEKALLATVADTAALATTANSLGDIVTASNAVYIRQLGSKPDCHYIVILLCETELNSTDNELPLMIGNIYTKASGTRRVHNAYINFTYSKWGSGNNLDSILINFGNTSGIYWDFITCNYNNTEYYALRLESGLAMRIYFSGIVNKCSLDCIAYYTSNEGKALNSEIYESIVSKNSVLKRTYNGQTPYALLTDNVASATKLLTAQTFKIGNTSHTFDGTSGVSWSLSDIGAAATDHTHDYLPIIGGSLTGNLNLLAALVAPRYTGTNLNYYIPVPSGGGYYSRTWVELGYIVIKLPSTLGLTLTSMWVDINNYVKNSACSIHIGGFISTSGAKYDALSAMVYGALLPVQFVVYNGYFYIYIGSSSSQWYNLQVQVRDIVAGYAPGTGWSDSIEIEVTTQMNSTSATSITDYAYTTRNLNFANLVFTEGTFTSEVTYTPNATNTTINIPTKTSHLTNDSDFITSSGTVANAKTLMGNTIGTVPAFDYYNAGYFSSEGWYKIFDFSYFTGSVIVNIGTNYSNTKPGNYIFAISSTYDGDITITQLSGLIGGGAISEVRVLKRSNSDFLTFEIYYNVNVLNLVGVKVFGRINKFYTTTASTKSEDLGYVSLNTANGVQIGNLTASYIKTDGIYAYTATCELLDVGYFLGDLIPLEDGDYYSIGSEDQRWYGLNVCYVDASDYGTFTNVYTKQLIPLSTSSSSLGTSNNTWSTGYINILYSSQIANKVYFLNGFTTAPNSTCKVTSLSFESEASSKGYTATIKPYGSYKLEISGFEEFVINNTATTLNIIPVSSSTYNLGSSDYLWNYLYANYIKATSYVQAYQVVPTQSYVGSLGNSNYIWGSLYTNAIYTPVDGTCNLSELCIFQEEVSDSVHTAGIKPITENSILHISNFSKVTIDNLELENYTLPKASSSVLGGIKITNNTISNSNSIKTDYYPLVTSDSDDITYAYVPLTSYMGKVSSTNSTNKLYIIGATTQASSVTTYSNSSVFISSNRLYSKGIYIQPGNNAGDTTFRLITSTNSSTGVDSLSIGITSGATGMTINESGHFWVSGNISTAGNSNVSGACSIGTECTIGGNLVVSGKVSSSLIPNVASSTYNLGSADNKWLDLYVNNITLGNCYIMNGDSYLDSLAVDVLNSTSTEGIMVYGSVNIKNGDINVKGDINVTGLITATDDIIGLYSSDRRLKTNIHFADYSSRILALGAVVEYNYNSLARSLNKGDDEQHTGIIYQNALNAEIEGLCKIDEDGYGIINPYSANLIFTTIGALQLTIREQFDIKEKIAILEDEIRYLKSLLDC